MYTKTDCKYCIWAKKFMQENGIAYHAIDIYVTPNGWNVLATVQRMTGQRSVPQLFVCGWFIGGNDWNLNVLIPNPSQDPS